jgi:hypothetical protein
MHLIRGDLDDGDLTARERQFPGLTARVVRTEGAQVTGCPDHGVQQLHPTTYLPVGAGSVPQLAENAGKVGAVCLAQPAEDPFGLGAAGRADRVEDAGAVLGQLDQRGPPVTRVGPPPDQAARFEGIGDLGGRARRDVQMV